MVKYRVLAAAVAVSALFLYGCSRTPQFVTKDEPWRDRDERSCLASGVVRETPYITTMRSALGGPSSCGALRPFEMSAALGGRVQMRPAATLQCAMLPAIETWVQDVVEPAARYFFRMPLAELKVAASYSCRPMNGVSGGKLSEHGHANAIDISAFTLANGRVITVKGGWYGAEDERQFLRAVHKGSCSVFTTVLGPLADSYHRDHFHMDLAHHGRDGQMRICK
jgi:hypothetical protein